MNALVDSHVHLDLVDRSHPQRIAWWRRHHVAVVSWSYCGRIPDTGALAACLQAHRQAVAEAAAAGLQARFLAGVHPRSIPDDLQPAGVADVLAPLLDDPLCAGLGEIGLETADRREVAVLQAQLEAARILLGPAGRIGLHTPRSNKLPVTERLLAVIEDGFADLKDKMVVDHCTPETIGMVLEKGLTAGVTLSAEKTSVDQLVAIVQRHGQDLDRIMCNTDSGSAFHPDLVEAAASGRLAEAVQYRIMYANAARFFGLEDAGATDHRR